MSTAAGGGTRLLLLALGFQDNCWVLLRLLLVPLCGGGRTPVEYELECHRLYYNPQDVACAGLWQVCHYFPFGYIPEFYYYTEPYCSNFADDEIPAEWLLLAQFLCTLALALQIVGMSACLTSDLLRSNDICGTASAILIISAACGFCGLVTFYSNISKSFLIPYKENIVSLNPHWGFFFYLQGCLLTGAAGLLLQWVKL